MDVEPLMAKVDVAVPCYQYGQFLRECITSILSQDLTDLRILIIDNASTDDSLQVARELAAEDSRVEILRFAVNRGPHAAYNAGIDWACADYFLILDADDLLAPGCLRRAVSVLDRHPSVSFTHGVEALARPGEPVPKIDDPQHPRVEISTSAEFIARLCRTPVNPVGAQTVVRRTAAQKEVGHYRPELPYTDDFEMWLRLASVGCAARIDAVQAIRRIHGHQDSNQFQRDNHVRDFREREAAFESFFAHEGRTIPGVDRLKNQMRRGLGEHAYWSAVSHACRGHLRAGLQLLRFSGERRRIPFLPPLGWLMRMERPMGRIADIGAEMIGWKRRA
jgi:glycosyltransferase involved in cell wall biosynthesis